MFMLQNLQIMWLIYNIKGNSPTNVAHKEAKEKQLCSLLYCIYILSNVMGITANY